MSTKKETRGAKPGGNNGGGKPIGYVSAFDLEQQFRTMATRCSAIAESIKKHRAVLNRKTA